jgi:hypothetical protein
LVDRQVIVGVGFISGEQRKMHNGRCFQKVAIDVLEGMRAAQQWPGWLRI